MTAALTTSMCMTSFAGSWEQAGTDWKYADNGTYMTGWQWIDGKSYYFDSNGIMAKNTVIDGYKLNEDGQWTVNGIIQTQGNQTENTGVNHSANYDPAHPLAGKIDEWNLRITPDKYSNYICDNNVQAMLTGQMSEYFAAPVGDYVDAAGNHIYTEQADYDNARANEQALYNWFCNLFNGMNFETMSEMEKARVIKDVLGQCSYDHSYDKANFRNPYYSVLIEKKGECSEFAMTATSLARALGLKSGINNMGTNHTVYYIQVDGKAYMGSNQILELNYPSPDFVYFQ